MWHTGTYQAITFQEIPDRLLDFYEKNKEYDEPISIVIGTDSQNFSTTKIVSVIAVVCKGHGGIYFYEISHIDLIQNVRLKLHKETSDSLEIAEKLVDMFDKDMRYHDMFLDCPLSIHIDAGNSEKGKTMELIPELVGWVKACGYDAEVKPDSFVSSSIADRISK